MDWNPLIEKYDKQNMLSHLRPFPKKIMEGIIIARNYKTKKKKFSNIVICGMGGSGIGGMVLKNVLKKEIKIPIEIVNDYELPAFVDNKTLVFTVSYSGNTEETVSCYREAKKKKATAIAITTGGMLGKTGNDCLLIPKAFPQPRLAFAHLFTPMMITLEKLGLIGKKEKELSLAIHALEKNRHAIETEAMRLALAMRGKNPVIYAQAEFSAIAYRFCTEINEDAKQFAHFQIVPEMNHNEINSKHAAQNTVLLLLRDRKERKKIQERFAISKKIWGNRFEIIETWVDGKTLLARALEAVWLESLAAFYLSLLNQEDPMEIPSISFLKKALKEKKG